ncbi:MAG: TonB-dependent receptor, partial [Campylobacterota bacterium]|nr:TonB-dependent receptor [Campylobacterota bacterium]
MKKIKLSITTALLLATNLYSSQDLGTINISSATKSEQSIKDITSNVEVITSYELEEKHISTVTEALNLISGVSFTSNGGIGATTSLNLRGMSNKRTLVLIDGIRFQDPSNTNGANISHLMVSDIEKIEIIKGAQSGIWGADATAGVVNIITKKAKNGLNGSIFVEGGSFNTKKIGGVVSHKNKNYDIKISANQLTTDSFTVQAPKGEDIKKYEDDSYKNRTINLATSYYINDNAEINLNITDIDTQKDYDSYHNPDDTNMSSDIENRLYNISFLQKLNNHNIKLKAQQSEFSRDEIGTVAQWGMQYVKVFEGTTKNIELNDNITYNENDFIVLGVGSSSDDVKYTKTDNSSEDKKHKDNYIYLTNSNKLNNTILTQSIRYDDYDNFDSKATGKLGIKHNYNSYTYVSSNIGTGYTVPNIVEELNPWGAINSELNPENSKSFDIGFGYKDIKITYFYNKIEDLIQWYDADGYGGEPAIYKNLDGKSTFKGIEIDYKKDIMQDLLLSLNYTNLNAKDKDGEDLARRAKEDFKFGIDYYGVEKLHLGLNGQYVGERYDKANKQGAQTGKYTIANFVANYDIKKDLKVYTKVDNITDK